jgi:hypothetical protein
MSFPTRSLSRVSLLSALRSVALGQSPLAASGQGYQHGGLHVGHQLSADRRVKIGDWGKPRAQQPEVHLNGLRQHVGIEPQASHGGGLWSSQELGGVSTAALGVTPTQRPRPSLSEPTGRLGGRVVAQQRQRDPRVHPGQDFCRPQPVGVGRCPGLPGGRNPGIDLAAAHPHQRLRLLGRGIGWLEPPHAVTVGVRVAGRLRSIDGHGLGTGGSPAPPGGVEGVVVDRRHGVASSKRRVYAEAGGLLDRDRQPPRRRESGETSERPSEFRFVLRKGEPIHNPTVVAPHGRRLRPTRPSPSCQQRPASFPSPCVVLSRSRWRLHSPLDRLFEPRVPKGGAAPARLGRRCSRWSLVGSRACPSPNDDRTHRVTSPRPAARVLER